MSRVGKRQIKIPQGVTVEISEGIIKVKGPKGILQEKLHKNVMVNQENGILCVSVKNPEIKQDRSLWGTFASHISNMIIGVTNGFEKKLEINGIGFKAVLKGKNLELFVGYSHQVLFVVPDGIEVSVEKN